MRPIRQRPTMKVAMARKSAKQGGDVARQLGLTKLESSGLDEDDARVLGIEFLEREQTDALDFSFHPLYALKLNYFDVFGDPLPDWPSCPPFFRIRYLEEAHDFESIAKKKDDKPLRYTQPSNTVVTAYFPQNMDWADIAADVSFPILITEGELKAAKACKEGFATIGLGGVESFSSRRYGVEFLASLEGIDWVRRTVYIVFDTDVKVNPNVTRAMSRLGHELMKRGAYPMVLNLPKVYGEDTKVGLDDFLIYSPTARDELHEMLGKQARPLGFVEPLFDLNDRYIYVEDPGLLVNRKTDAKVSASAFKDHIASTKEYWAGELATNGTVQFQQVSAAAAWLQWPLRASVDKLTYAPGKPKLVENGLTMYNTWKGWGVEPKTGDVAMFMKLVDHIFEGEDPKAKQWYLRWLAFPLQYPGTKLFSSVLIFGRRHGTGKSLLGYTMGRIYGKNFTEIKQRNLHENYNEWAENKQFVMGDDVTGSNKREDNDLLKNMITQKELRINPKYIPSYVVPDCINYYFTSNHADAFFLDDDDRRFFVHETRVRPLDEEFYMDYDLWLDSGGAEAVFDFLQHLPLGDFNPAGHAFMTAAKQRMISDVQSDLGAWVRRLINDPDSVLKIGEVVLRKDLFTNRELLELYDPTHRTGTTANGLGREMRRAGIEMVCNGKPIKGPDGADRYYAVKNPDEWDQATPEQVLEHITGWLKRKTEKKGSKY